jgi:putative acetyltransferase
MEIRPEAPGDHAAIGAVTGAAFAGAAHASGTEAAIVEALRAAGALTLSLVAVAEGEIVGHAAFSPVMVAGRAVGWFGLGPVSVRPDRQGEGIGSALIRDGLSRLEAAGGRGCVVLGDPAFYRRFGFEQDPGLRYEAAPAEYFLRRVLRGAGPVGRVGYHPAFGGPA